MTGQTLIGLSRCGNLVSAQLLALRQLLHQRFPNAAPLTQRLATPVPTGLSPLDRILPGGGLPRGKLTAWTPNGGATAVLLAACQMAVATGERAAWLDTSGTVGPDWERWKDGPLLIRPTEPIRRNALRCAEVLLRSGGIAVVVLSGAEPTAPERVRLTRAAREGGGVFVILTDNPSLATLRVASRILPDSYRWERGPFDNPAAPVEATVEVRARTLGWNANARVVLPVSRYELRLSLDPELADRRGIDRVARSNESRIKRSRRWESG